MLLHTKVCFHGGSIRKRSAGSQENIKHLIYQQVYHYIKMLYEG